MAIRYAALYKSGIAGDEGHRGEDEFEVIVNEVVRTSKEKCVAVRGRVERDRGPWCP